MASLKTHENNPLRLAVRTISEVTSALNKPEEANAATTAEKPRPQRVEIVETAEPG